jgi:hypothetical protein
MPTITAKPPENVENGLALAPQRFACHMRSSAVEPEEKVGAKPPVQPRYHTPALPPAAAFFAAGCAVGLPFLARRTDLLDIDPDDAVLEIGTGLGYQSAIFAQLARKVYGIGFQLLD